MGDGSRQIYHEKQLKQLCALHTLNNLFQSADAYSKCLLDELCHRLSPNSWVNPHRSSLGLGNYDINVLISALQIRQCDMTWWDKRRSPTEIDTDNIVGFILNISSNSKIGRFSLPFKSKHWIAVRRFGLVYYNLDSKLDEPFLIGPHNKLMEFLELLKLHTISKYNEYHLLVISNNIN
nr:EOG090X0HOM [Leptodora kindtii]